MRYNLGYMDKYPIEAAGTNIENNPMYKIKLHEPVDPIRLEDSIKKAIEVYPLFGTKVKFHKEYYLETNTNPIIIFNVKDEDRPKAFGKGTNDYPWQCCYFENVLTFEWLHGVTDGKGALDFVSQVLIFYFKSDYKLEKSVLVAPGLEPFKNANEKGKEFELDKEGFSFKDFPKKYKGYTTDYHFLKGETKEILSCAKACRTSVTPVISVLFSQAIRKHLPLHIKNRNVACNIVLDLRKPLMYETMHNCVEYKRITYLDSFDDLSFADVTREYKKKLDVVRDIPNTVRMITDRLSLFRLYHVFHSRRFIKFVVTLIGLFMKDTDCNFVLTYLGKVNLPREILDRIEDFEIKVWHDFGECIIACIDLDGQFNICISENFKEKGVIEDFIDLCKEKGIHLEEKESGVFIQSHFKEN